MFWLLHRFPIPSSTTNAQVTVKIATANDLAASAHTDFPIWTHFHNFDRIQQRLFTAWPKLDQR